MFDLTGQRFGLLSVTRRAPGGGYRQQARWECQCDCGNTHVVVSRTLRDGRTRSCGCMERRNLDGSGVRRTHGMSNSPEYRAWGKMISRCTDPKNNRFRHYGARGITVCNRLSPSQAGPPKPREVAAANVELRPLRTDALDRASVHRGENEHE